MTKLFYILSLLIIKVASNYISTHLWSGEKKLKKRVLLQTLILTACFLPTHGQDSFLCFQTNVQKSNISIHEQRMKHPGIPKPRVFTLSISALEMKIPAMTMEPEKRNTISRFHFSP